jgi:MFS family permease
MRCVWATICCSACSEFMGQRREVLIVYAAGTIQGVALVTFPAASAVFTSPIDYGLSSTEYGGMFVPQAIMAIISSLLGLGTALAPVFIVLFAGWGMWWGLPVMVGGLILALLILSVWQPLNDRTTVSARAPRVKVQLPTRFWTFAIFALLYGVSETMNANWAAPYMKEQFGASTSVSSLALMIFWSMVTLGRMFCAVLEKWIPDTQVCRILPLVVTTALIASACMQTTDALLGVFIFALAGLGCSALLP